MTNFLTARLCASLLALGFFVIQSVAGEVVPVLQTKTERYANVTVVSHTATHLFIQHSRGVANIKLADLDAPGLQSLGISAAIPTTGADFVDGEQGEAPPPGTGSAKPRSLDLLAFLKAFKPAPGTPGADFLNTIMKFLVVILVILLCLYLLHCYCVKLICEKSGYKPGLRAWLPILQEIALIRASGMSTLWYLAFILPNIMLRFAKDRFAGWQFALLGAGLLMLVAHVLWCIRICQARGKGALATIFLIIPGTYPFAFLYLAFSGGGARATDTEDAPPVKSVQTEPLPA